MNLDLKQIVAVGFTLSIVSLAHSQVPGLPSSTPADQFVAVPVEPPAVAFIAANQQPVSAIQPTVNDDFLVSGTPQPARVLAERYVDVATSGNDRALIVRSTETDAKTLTAMEEDLNIMSRILEKSARTAESNTGVEAMGLPIVTTGGNSRATQIEGYGVLFQLTVGFPLRGTEDKAEEKSTKPAPDSPWEQTRRELQGHGTDPFSVLGTGEPGLQSKRNAYDAKRVDRLKNSLLEGLKNASNMSHVKPDENIMVLVKSSARPILAFVRTTSVENPPGFAAAGTPPRSSPDTADVKRPASNTTTARRVSAYKSGWAANAEAGAVLSIRAKKSDIDAFAAGKLNLDEFRKKALILVY